MIEQETNSAFDFIKSILINPQRTFDWNQIAGVEKSNSESISDQDLELGVNLILEEFCEMVSAFGERGKITLNKLLKEKLKEIESGDFKEHAQPDNVEILDGVSDVLFTLFGLAYRVGIPSDLVCKAYTKVCKSNDTKFSTSREDAEEGAKKAIEQGKAKFTDIKEVTLNNGVTFYVILNENNKIMKPEQFKKPDLRKLIDGASSKNLI